MSNNFEEVRTLTDLGLSGAQARTYLALIHVGSGTIREIAEVSNAARPDTYRAIVFLQQEGIVEKIVSLPAKYKALPVADAVGILMLKRSKENIELNKRVNELIKQVEKWHSKPHNEEEQFVLVREGDALELKFQKLIETSEDNLCIKVSWQRMFRFIVDHYKTIEKALQRKVNIRILTEQQFSSKKLKEISALEKYLNFEIRYLVGPPTVWLRIRDGKEIILHTKSTDDLDLAVLSNNSGLIELAQNFFDSAWFSAIEPQNQEFKRDRRQFDYLFANMTRGFAYNKIIFGDDGKPIDFTILAANDAFEEITGISKDKRGKKASNILPMSNKDFTEMLESYGQTVISGKSVKFERYFEGLQKWLSILVYTPEKGYFASILEDITERQKLENDLQESEEKYRLLVSIAHEGIIALNSEDEIIFANPRMYEIVGTKEGELIGKSLFWYIPERGLAHAKYYLDFCKAGLGGEFELELLDAGGKVINALFSASPIKDQGGKWLGSMAVVSDITARKKEEQELKESEMKYRTLVEQSPEGILLGQGPLPHIVYANPAMKNISGYSVQELSSFTFQQTVGLVHPDDRELFFERFKDRLEGKPTPERYMFRGIKKDGTIIWVDLSSALIEYKGQPTVQAIFRDITDQVNTEERIKQSEEKFKESEEKYHRLAIYAPVAIYEIDCKSLRFKCVNEYMSKISGYSEKELLSMSPLELLDAESKGIFQNIMRKSIAGEKIDENIEFGVITKDGRHLWSTLSAKLTYKNNELDSAFVVAYNFNKEKKGRL